MLINEAESEFEIGWSESMKAELPSEYLPSPRGAVPASAIAHMSDLLNNLDTDLGRDFAADYPLDRSSAWFAQGMRSANRVEKHVRVNEDRAHRSRS